MLVVVTFTTSNEPISNIQPYHACVLYRCLSIRSAIVFKPEENRSILLYRRHRLPYPPSTRPVGLECLLFLIIHVNKCC
ncbi:hypothetical protein Y032_0032g2478 [Ancylostoma ceylanicum]|uniref:Uncharacterized protein n=1 Tax=Ancylostoma ceylanicum TaxID=53326 RepID=A0A016UMY6_9BILA|nr:hypothetical protein Y032_0032g2478 [Ancylostoma ceylanicum]